MGSETTTWRPALPSAASCAPGNADAEAVQHAVPAKKINPPDEHMVPAKVADRPNLTGPSQTVATQPVSECGDTACVCTVSQPRWRCPRAQTLPRDRTSAPLSPFAQETESRAGQFAVRPRGMGHQHPVNSAKPETSNSKPESQNLEPGTRNLKPESQNVNSVPGILLSKPKTRNHKSRPRNHQPNRDPETLTRENIVVFWVALGLDRNVSLPP